MRRSRYGCANRFYEHSQRVVLVVEGLYCRRTGDRRIAVGAVGDLSQPGLLVCGADQTVIQPAELDLWACLDGPLPFDGLFSLARPEGR